MTFQVSSLACGVLRFFRYNLLVLVAGTATTNPARADQSAPAFDPQHAIPVFKDLEQHFANFPVDTKRDSPLPAHATQKLGDRPYEQWQMSWTKGGTTQSLYVCAFRDAADAKAFADSRAGTYRTFLTAEDVPEKPKQQLFRSKRMFVHSACSGRFVVFIRFSSPNSATLLPETSLIDLILSRLEGTSVAPNEKLQLFVKSPDPHLYDDYTGVVPIPDAPDTEVNVQITVVGNGQSVDVDTITLNGDQLDREEKGVYQLTYGKGSKKTKVRFRVELRRKSVPLQLVFSKQGYRTRKISVEFDPEAKDVVIPGIVYDWRLEDRARTKRGLSGVTVTLKDNVGEKVVVGPVKTQSDGRFDIRLGQGENPVPFKHQDVGLATEGRFEVAIGEEPLGVYEKGQWHAAKIPVALRIPTRPELRFVLTYQDQNGQKHALGETKVQVEIVDNASPQRTKKLPVDMRRPYFATLESQDGRDAGIVFSDDRGNAHVTLNMQQPNPERRVASTITLKITVGDRVTKKDFESFSIEIPFDVLLVAGRINPNSIGELKGLPRGPGRYHLRSRVWKKTLAISDPKTDKKKTVTRSYFSILVSRPEQGLYSGLFLNKFRITWDTFSGTTPARVEQSLVGQPLMEMDGTRKGTVAKDSIPPRGTYVDLGWIKLDKKANELTFSQSPPSEP